MKTAEEYWKKYAEAVGFGGYHDFLCVADRAAISAMVVAIAADARAEALAEKPKEPDADEERAKREHDRFQSFLPESYRMEFEAHCDETIAAWKAYAATLPEHPKRSPGQVLFDAEKANGLWVGIEWDGESRDSLNDMTRQKLERIAAALSIQPAE